MLREGKHWPRNWSDGSWAGIKVQAPGSPSLGHPSPYLGWDPVVLSLFTKSFLLFVPWWEDYTSQTPAWGEPRNPSLPPERPSLPPLGETEEPRPLLSPEQRYVAMPHNSFLLGWAISKRGPPITFQTLSIFVTLIFRMNLRPVLFLANAVFLAFFRRTEAPSEAGKWQDFCPQAHKLMVSGSQANHFLASELHFSPSTHTACYLHM